MRRANMVVGESVECYFLLVIVAFILVSARIHSVTKSAESPQFTVVHSESEFEVRLYRDSPWITAPVDDTSFRKASIKGFHRVFEYIQGANLNSSRISMTFPVVTSIEPGLLNSSAYLVRFYLPKEFQEVPPVPLPELNLIPDSWSSHCVAVRKFSKLAKDEIIVKQAEKLASSLSRSPWANSTSTERGYAYSLAQYYSPYWILGLYNEIWVDVSGSEENGCKSSPLASY